MEEKAKLQSAKVAMQDAQDYFSRGELKNAIAEFQQAANLAPNDEKILRALERAWRMSVSQNPRAPENYIGLGQACQRSGFFEPAKEYYYRAITLSKNKFNPLALSCWPNCPQAQNAASQIIFVADRLTKMGYKVDWQKHSLSQMQDLETRIGISNRLQAMGEDVPWQHRSLSDLLDIQSRIEISKRLQQMGQNVDWKTHSLGEMLNMEAGGSNSTLPKFKGF